MCTKSDFYSKEFFLTKLKVEDKDITSLHNAFANSNPDLLLDAILMVDPAWRSSASAIQGSARQALLGRVKATLRLMYSIEPSVEESSSELIIPWQDFRIAGDGHAIVRGLGSCILDCSFLDEAQSRLEHYGEGALLFSNFVDRVDKGDHPLEALEESGLLEPIQVISLESWSEILGRCIWLPSNLCELERYSVLASVFWSMSYSGFGYYGNVEDEIDSLSQCSLEDVSFYCEFTEKMELFAEALNYSTWVSAIEAGHLLCRYRHSLN